MKQWQEAVLVYLVVCAVSYSWEVYLFTGWRSEQHVFLPHQLTVPELLLEAVFRTCCCMVIYDQWSSGNLMLGLSFFFGWFHLDAAWNYWHEDYSKVCHLRSVWMLTDCQDWSRTHQAHQTNYYPPLIVAARLDLHPLLRVVAATALGISVAGSFEKAAYVARWWVVGDSQDVRHKTFLEHYNSLHLSFIPTMLNYGMLLELCHAVQSWTAPRARPSTRLLLHTLLACAVLQPWWPGPWQWLLPMAVALEVYGLARGVSFPSAGSVAYGHRPLSPVFQVVVGCAQYNVVSGGCAEWCFRKGLDLLAMLRVPPDGSSIILTALGTYLAWRGSRGPVPHKHRDYLLFTLSTVMRGWMCLNVLFGLLGLEAPCPTRERFFGQECHPRASWDVYFRMFMTNLAEWALYEAAIYRVLVGRPGATDEERTK